MTSEGASRSEIWWGARLKLFLFDLKTDRFEVFPNKRIPFVLFLALFALVGCGMFEKRSELRAEGLKEFKSLASQGKPIFDEDISNSMQRFFVNGWSVDETRDFLREQGASEMLLFESPKKDEPSALYISNIQLYNDLSGVTSVEFQIFFERRKEEKLELKRVEAIMHSRSL